MKGLKKKSMMIGIAFLCVIVISIVWICFSTRKWKESDFENGEYQGVFCTMLSNPDFSEADFLTYRGLNIVKSENKLESFRDIFNMMKIVFTHNPGVETVYMEIDPLILWEDAGAKEERWLEYLGKYISETMQQRSTSIFEILLPYPEISYLTEMEEGDWEVYVWVYQSFVQFFEGNDNVLISYVGAEQWLNSNPDNYVDTHKLNTQVEKSVFLAVFCDRKYLTNGNGIKEKLEELRMQATEYLECSEKYPDYSDWSFVFLGDSIIGIDMSTRSIPGVVGALSGAKVYNCGKNGASAALVGKETVSLSEMVALLKGNNNGKITDEEKLCIFLNFGLNDYFLGYPIENPEDAYDVSTYTGALRSGIKQLKELYPKAQIVILIPTYIYTYNEGDVLQGESGQVLNAYRDAAKLVAEEMEIYYKDNYGDMPVNASNYKKYLSDECHLNEMGRFLFGKQLVFYLEESVIK